MPSLTSFAETLLASAKEVDAELEACGIPFPSFDNDTLEQLPLEAQKKRWKLMDASNQFQQLTRGAALSTYDIAWNWTDALSLRIIYYYKLASAVPVDGSASYEEIAATSGLDKSLVFRTLRYAMSNNMFDEDESGRVRHTAISRMLATNQTFYDGIGLGIDEIGPSSTQVIAAWEKYGQTTGEPTHSAFSLYNGSDKSMFAILEATPERARRFGSAMRFYTSEGSWDMRQVLAAFDWSTLDKPGSRIIDCGGGNGQLSQLLAQETKYLSFTVQDLPNVVADGLKQLPKELKERINFQAKDFMTPQEAEHPPSGFLICRCTHNWSDKYAARMLKNLVPAFRKGSKLLIIDHVLAEKPTKSLMDKGALQLDFTMTTIQNALERRAADFKNLLKMSDERFVLEKITKMENSDQSLIVVGWSG
ncbi:MAG: hypothetical protein Q9227_008814 [Pyrenula ochraceoflavens]